MRSIKRRPWVVLLRVGVGAATLLLLFRFVKIDEVGRALQSAAIAGVVAGVALNIATRSAAAARTYALSRAARFPVSFAHTLQALFISNFWGLVLPGVPAGSAATVWRYRGHGAGVMQSVAVLSASRVIELLAFCMLALLGLATSMGVAVESRVWMATTLIAVMIVMALGLILLQRLPQSVQPAAGQASALRSVAHRISATVGTALQLLRDLPGSALMRSFVWALLQGVLDAATVLVLALALGIPIGLPDALWINALSYLAILLPLSAAGVGLREVAVLAALLPLGIARADALALALLMLAMTLVNALAGALVQVLTPRA